MVAKGPCLCGDPHCSSCGDPSLGALEDAEQRLWDGIPREAGPNFYDFLTALVPNLFKVFNEAVDREVQERMTDNALYIAHLESKIEREEEDA